MSFHALNASKSKCIATVLVLLVLVGLVASQGLLHVASAQPYYPYGGGLVAGYIIGFNVYDELIPISWASITATVDSQVVGVTSSLGGGYFEMFLPVGFYNLTVEEYGFISKTMQIFVSSGSSTTLQFILEQGQRIYTYPVTVNIVGFSSDYYSNLRVNGKYEGIVQGGRSKTFMFRLGSTHQLDVDPYVKGPSGVRYYSTTVNQTVNGKDSITFTYQPEYYLHLEKRIIDFSSIEGWYGEGSLVEIPSAPQYVNGTLGVRYIFEYWMVDGTKVVGNPVSVVMDRPHNVSTRYRTQYYVDVKSEHGNPTGSGWFDANSTVTVSVTTPQGLGVQRVFDRWEGDQVSTSPTISILVDSPTTLTAVWHDDYTQVYAVILIILATLIFAALSVRSRKRVETNRT
jgi:hypothetical protein